LSGRRDWAEVLFVCSLVFGLSFIAGRKAGAVAFAPEEQGCGGTPGLPCPCAAAHCLEPCTSCCDSVPCPVNDPTCGR
jgi:hypothetical protein